MVMRIVTRRFNGRGRNTGRHNINREVGMVGQYKDGHGHTRNFAYRVRNTVATSLRDDDQMIELNPIIRDMSLDDRMTVQMKDPGIKVIKHVNGVFVSDEVVYQGGNL
jgi:hypothetical protein